MDLDKVLVSLSLREDEADMGDAMDIDGGSGFSMVSPSYSNETKEDIQRDGAGSETSLNSHEYLDEKKAHSTDDEIEVKERSLVVSLLSPTRLGAHYAINHKKDQSVNDDVDQSFNTSSDSLLKENHKSTFNTVNGSDLYFKPSYTVHEPDSQPPAPYENQSQIHGMFGRPFMPFPVQVHHHHYYTPPHLQGSSTSSLAVNEADNQLRQRQVISGAKEQLAVRRSENQLQTLVQSHELPPPWDARSSPAEEQAYMFSSYLQLAVNAIVSAYAIHLVWTIVAAIRKDVSHKLSRHAKNLLIEIAMCERLYNLNNCHPDEIVPALEKECAYWEQCMLQDPERGGNVSSLGAQTIGMVITSLIEPLSFKALLVFASVVFLVYVYNFAFGYIRARTYYGT